MILLMETGSVSTLHYFSIKFLLSVAALIASLSGNLLINHKKIIGFYVWILSDFLWIAVIFMNVDVNFPQIGMYVAYVLINAEGIVKWKRGDKYGKR